MAPIASQATPLCIRSPEESADRFLVCGRFPSMLMYDLRKGLEVTRSAYSGAESLSCITGIFHNHVVVGGSYHGKSCHVLSVH